VVLAVSITSAAFTISTFVRQGSRFEYEDERRAPRVNFIVQISNAQDGWMRTVLGVQNSRDADLTIQSVEVISPSDMRLAKCDCPNPANERPIPTTASKIMKFENVMVGALRQQNTGSAAWGRVIWVRAANPRGRDLIVRFNFREKLYPFRPISRSAAATVYD